METEERFVLDGYRPTDDEAEKACNSYLMSLIAVVMGLPMPVINLLATGIFYFISRKSTPFVRWHCLQALLSQIPLFLMNNILFWWTVRIVLCLNMISNEYITYFILVNMYNVWDFYATTKSAILVRKGITYRWRIYGPLTDMLFKEK